MLLVVVVVVRSGELAIKTGMREGDIYFSRKEILVKCLPYPPACLVQYCSLFSAV